MDDDFFSAPAPGPTCKTATDFDDIIVASGAAAPPATAPTESRSREPSAEAVAVAPAPAAASPSTTQPPQPAQKFERVVAEQLKVIADRTAAIDKATHEKEDRLKKAALAYLAEETRKRDAKIQLIRQDHRKQQAELEKKASALHQSGAVWQGLSLLVDLKKPNSHSKKTERMKQVLLAAVQQTAATS